MEDKNVAMARRIAEAVDAAGGRTYYVGGYVRDRLMGLESKDVDIEIHGISVRALEEILDGLGERIATGASFGVMGLRHYELDIAMPRSEKATGRGHRDFEILVDPFIGEEKAAQRRDFTMNALMENVLTGKVLDFFGGRADILQRRIRHVSDATFADDPLRVFRAAQFAARFGCVVAEETMALSSQMDVGALAAERVMAELEKALVKAERPSVFFEQLRRMKQLNIWFFKLRGLSWTAWRMTMSTLDEAAALRDAAEAPLYFMISALCLALEDEDAAKSQLGRLTDEVRLGKYALNMYASFHGLTRRIETGAGTHAWMTLFDSSVCPEDLLLLAQAEAAGRGAKRLWTGEQSRLEALLALYRERMKAPFVMGRDLAEAGMAPGRHMGEALAYAHELRLAGMTKEQQLAMTMEYMRGEMNGAR